MKHVDIVYNYLIKQKSGFMAANSTVGLLLNLTGSQVGGAKSNLVRSGRLVITPRTGKFRLPPCDDIVVPERKKSINARLQAIASMGFNVARGVV